MHTVYAVNQRKYMKSAGERAVRKTITLPPKLNEVIPKVIRAKGFSGLSGYVQAQIRRDAHMDVEAA